MVSIFSCPSGWQEALSLGPQGRGAIITHTPFNMRGGVFSHQPRFEELHHPAYYFQTE